jgi:hypothetical protein
MLTGDRTSSSNGRGGAYFLQYKPQLGGARFIWELRMFGSANDNFDAPILLFLC